VDAPGAFLFKHFLPWIHNLMLHYQDQKELEIDPFTSWGDRFSEGYYTKKLS
jgi:hypothetical protein